MYRCEACKSVVSPKTPLRKHVTYREKEATKIVAGELRTTSRKEIDSELNVCGPCLEKLSQGVHISILRGARQSPPELEVVVSPLTEDVEEPKPLERKVKPKRKVEIKPAVNGKGRN